MLLFCVAIAARAPFEGVPTFDSYQACAELQKFNHGGEGPISRESPYCVSRTFEALAKQKNMLLPKVV